MSTGKPVRTRRRKSARERPRPAMRTCACGERYEVVPDDWSRQCPACQDQLELPFE